MTVMASDEPTSGYVTVAELAHELHVSESTIRRRIRDRELFAAKLGSERNSAIRIPRTAVREWLDGSS